MALFGKSKTDKKEKKAAAAVEPQETPTRSRVHADSDVSAVLRSPRITEKATMHQAEGVYTFDVAENATKHSVIQAVAAAYKVVPKKVRIVAVPSKRKRSARTGVKGVTRRSKKAYVYLPKGETITIG